jgi:hypothetical protein
VNEVLITRGEERDVADELVQQFPERFRPIRPPEPTRARAWRAATDQNERVLFTGGDEFDRDHPLVVAYPGHFNLVPIEQRPRVACLRAISAKEVVDRPRPASAVLAHIVRDRLVELELLGIDELRAVDWTGVGTSLAAYLARVVPASRLTEFDHRRRERTEASAR